jgi:type I restriction-modification system DNA methylase subunit
VFTKALNALSARDIKGLVIQTMTADGLLIDNFNDTEKVWYTLLAKPINGAQITVDTDETFTPATFTFVLTLANKILPGSYVEIVLPPEVKLVDNQTPEIVAGSNFDSVHSSI